MHYYNEIDPYCCQVLRARIADGSLPKGFVDERDIREVRPVDLAGYRQCHFFAGIGGFALGLKWAGADGLPLWTGGFPCQDISLAGGRAGIDGERSGMWGTWCGLIRAFRPENLIVENVAALLIPTDDGLPAPISRVLGDLAAGGFDAEWDCYPAGAFGAHHLRDRVFIFATRTNAIGLRPQGQWTPPQGSWSREQFEGLLSAEIRLSLPAGKAGGISDGVPHRKHRLHALGNAIVPQIAEWIGRRLLTAQSKG